MIMGILELINSYVFNNDINSQSENVIEENVNDTHYEKEKEYSKGYLKKWKLPTKYPKDPQSTSLQSLLKIQ